jgi:hypothetical protein
MAHLRLQDPHLLQRLALRVEALLPQTSGAELAQVGGLWVLGPGR